MKSNEVNFIITNMAVLKPRVYVEWGIGFSTSLYPLFAQETYGLDNNRPWCEKVGGSPVVKCLESFHAIKIRCTVEFRLLRWGWVNNSDASNMAKHYVEDNEGILDAIRQQNKTVDVALIDGRFRVACALRLLPYLSTTGHVFVHDFWKRQHVYHPILQHYDVVSTTGSIVMLKSKYGVIIPPGVPDVYRTHLGNQS